MINKFVHLWDRFHTLFKTRPPGPSQLGQQCLLATLNCSLTKRDLLENKGTNPQTIYESKQSIEHSVDRSNESTDQPLKSDIDVKFTSTLKSTRT